MTRNRAPVIGEDVYFYLESDTGSQPVLAKVMEVATYNNRVVKLYFYDATFRPREFILHASDPLLENRPEYRRIGCWDWHPQIAQLFDMTLQDMPSAEPELERPSRLKPGKPKELATV